MALSHADHQQQPEPNVPHFLPVIDSIQGSVQDEEPMLLLEDDEEDLVNSGA